MDETVVCSSESKEFKATENGFVEPASSTVFPFPRRIQFQPARQPFLGFNDRDDDFHLETLNPSPQIRQPVRVQNAKKFDSTDVLETGLSPELSFSITFRKIGAGLENLGNTCFLNSVLQCLTYTEPLAAYLQSGKHQTSCRVVGFCALCAIQRHVNRALESTGRILAPKDLVSNLRCISRNFRIARQEDAHEYMVNLLESMHKCCLPLGIPSESPGAYEKSLVHKIFGGRLRSQVKCMQCFYSSNKFDPFLDLSLEIHKADTLYKALSHFTSPEELDGGERQYQCQHCKQKVRALKQLTVHKAPYVLTVHLKRFASHNPGQKIDKKVQFGATLDLKRFVSGSYDDDLNYTLYGVLVHAGWSTHSGHYYCFIRTSSAIWYSLDDNRVFQVSEKTVLEQKAYMLFYVRDTKSAPSKKPSEIPNSNPRSLRSRVDMVSPVSHESASKRSAMNESFIKDSLRDGPLKGDLDESSIKGSSLKEERRSDQTLLTSPTYGLISEEIPKKVEQDEVERAASDLENNKNNENAIPSTSIKCSNKPKKNSKLQFPNMRFAARMLLLQSQRKEIRKRRMRRKSLRVANSVDRSLSDVEPSTSERSREDSHDIQTNNARDGRHGESAAGPSNAGRPGSVEQNPRGPVQNGFVRLLTRGLEDTLVGRWDNNMEKPRPMVESDDIGVKQIGYVLDEWDEEYDKGKRKKLRKSQECFGEPNPFQKIAAQKMMLKKMKVNRLGLHI